MSCDAIDLRCLMADVTDDQIAAQIAHERDQGERGEARVRRGIEADRESGQAGRTPGFRAILQQAALPLSIAIEEEIERLQQGAVRRKPPELRTLRLLEPKDLAVVALRTLLDDMGDRTRPADKRTLQSVARRIGDRVATEYMARGIYDASPALLRHVTTPPPDRGQRNYGAGIRRSNIVKTYLNRLDDTEPPMTTPEMVRLGVFILTVLEEAEVVVTKAIPIGPNRTKTIVTFTETVWDKITKIEDRATLLRPTLLPSIIPPRPWETQKSGGAWTPRSVGGMALVKARSPGNGARDLTYADIPEVFDAINYLQNTPYRVNRRVLEVASRMRDVGLSCSSLPNSHLEALPAIPADIATNAEARKAYREHAAAVHSRNAHTRANTLSALRTLSLAEELRDRPQLWFAKMLDFRGRVYDAGQFLFPQGTDLARGLLEYANGKPLGEEGAEWLAIHVANCYGEDKLSFADRVNWVHLNEGRILAAARDPFEERFWLDADEPMQFLAACFEWQGLRREGVSYVSHCRVGLDGTCNGLQHLSALLRDPIGGKAVNLLPGDQPADIYTEVLHAVTAELKRRAELGEPTAQAWLPLMKRSVVKRPVMTLPYGATRQGYADQIMEDTIRPLEKAAASPFGKDAYAAARYLAAIVWDATGQVVVAGRQAMEWLQDVAKVVGKRDAALRWTAPTGFPVVQQYLDYETRLVELRCLGQRVVFRLNKEDGSSDSKVNVQKMKRSVAPNFVHAMDAAHMLRTTEQIVRTVGPSVHLTMIHDSYATHACDVGALAAAIRQAFVQMYQERDWLEAFRDDIAASTGIPLEEFPPLPGSGTLELSDVINSQYFFG